MSFGSPWHGAENDKIWALGVKPTAELVKSTMQPTRTLPAKGCFPESRPPTWTFRPTRSG